MLCISANPAIDRRLRVEGLAIGKVNRALSVQAMPGGKATHVALAAKALGAKPQWIGFLGGATGAELKSALLARVIPVVAVSTKAPTRQNLEIIDESGNVTEILEPGGPLGPKEISRMKSACRKLFQKNAGYVVVLSGSLPRGAPRDLYAQLIVEAHRHSCRVVLDTSGDALMAALPSRPDLVKPNRDEAERILARPITDLSSAAEAVHRLVEQGARSAAVSLGVEGIVWLEDAGAPVLVARPPQVACDSAVGCGDTTVAGFAYAAITGKKGREALRLAVACGTANCFAEIPGMITSAQVKKLLLQVVVQSL